MLARLSERIEVIVYGLTRPLQRIEFFSDRSALKQAKWADSYLRMRLEIGLAEAKKKNAPDKDVDLILRQYQFESETIWHPIYARDSQRLVAQARKYHISVPPFPNEDQNANRDWYISRAVGNLILTQEGEERLKREIRNEKRQHNDEVRKWAAVVISVAAFVLAFLSLMNKTKQPDPCTKNYYRSDSGECVFAFGKISSPQPNPTVPPSVANPPISAPQLKKPKP